MDNARSGSNSPKLFISQTGITGDSSKITDGMVLPFTGV